MPYATQATVEQVFGADNVSSTAGCWADYDNTFNAATITTNINAKITQADAELDAKFRKAGMAIPVVTITDGTTPPLVSEIAATLAGIKLFMFRGVVQRGQRGESRHALSQYQDWVDEQVELIIKADVDIDARYVNQ